MPLLKIVTNQTTAEAKHLTGRLSAEVSAMLGKPEEWVMVILDAGREMRFAGRAEPAAYVELKSLGLPKGKVSEFSSRLCAVIGGALAIPQDRIYIEFSDVIGPLWGWNGDTF